MTDGGSRRSVPAGGPDPRLDRAESMAASLLVDAAARRRPRERRQAARLARILADPAGRSAILALTDEVLRIDDPPKAADVLAGVVLSGGGVADDWRSARFLGPGDRLLYLAGGRLARYLPAAVMPLLRRRVLAEMSGVVLPADRVRLARHIARRRSQGMRLNVNVLGEAVLGEDEATRRLEQILDVLSRSSVDYVSVKVSAICSQLDVLDFDHEVGRVADRLRLLYRSAASAQPSKFVNLDMEEYRDLDLTVAVFREVLDEPEFRHLDAGIVLQAYLPDSLGALESLCSWARHRRDDTRDGDRRAGVVKVRLVKGANLAMEAVDAELHGWTRAPFATKAETDANYKRMLSTALDPLNDGAVRVGVATHNLFELAWAATVADSLGQQHRLELEMLEGMSPAVSEAVASRFGGLLLYAPVVDAADFEAAIAYLVRRLDENGAPQNFLAHQFSMALGSPAWSEETRRFRSAVSAARSGGGRNPGATRRRQDRSEEESAGVSAAASPFANQPDTDFTRAVNRKWVAAHVRRVGDEGLPEYRPVIGGRPTREPADQMGIDPGRPARPAYRWASASPETVHEAIAAARTGREEWASTPPGERAAILRQAAAGLGRNRGRLLAVMAVDTAKTVREGDPEVSEAVDFGTYYAGHVPEPAAGFRPYGTVVVASPWNFPLSIPAGGVLGSLAAGNTVILKPAPEAVAVAGEMVRALWAGGVPRAALHFVPCADGEASRLLISSDEVDAVVLTGSWDTAQMFLGWRPDLALHAETSGKNSIVVTSTADPDQAISDLVHSAFGHAGQKCSAASLAIVEDRVLDDGRFLRRLADAVASLRVGPAQQLGSVVGPLIRPPEGSLATALNRLEAGESWLVEPRQLDRDGYLWSPGVKTGVEPGSPFHLSECFGPVLGIMRTGDLDSALRIQNMPDYGLTAGLQALDPAEIEHWRARAEAGNLYVNRGITGAVVGRQPFGGWKRSVVGSGAKAGGPNYVASLGTWESATGPAGDPGSLRRRYRLAWQRLGRPTDTAGLRAESNVLRYRPLRSVAVHGGSPDDRRRAQAAAAALGVEVEFMEMPSRATVGRFDKLRLLGGLSAEVLREAAGTGVWVDVRPIAAEPGRELLRWAHEQVVSESRHRHGDVTLRRPGLLPPRPDPGP